MTAPAPVPDGTTPPAEAVEAAHTAFRDYVLRDDKDPSVDGGVFRAVAAAVVAALRLPDRDRETAAKALNEAAWALDIPNTKPYTREDSIGAAGAPDWLRARASALRERRES